jgi:hypothetical protein
VTNLLYMAHCSIAVDNNIGHAGAKRLAEALEKNGTLTTLGLSGGCLRTTRI